MTTTDKRPADSTREPGGTGYAAAPLAAPMALIPACRAMCGAKPSLMTTFASHPKPARKPPKTITSPPAVSPDDLRSMSPATHVAGLDEASPIAAPPRWEAGIRPKPVALPVPSPVGPYVW